MKTFFTKTKSLLVLALALAPVLALPNWVLAAGTNVQTNNVILNDPYIPPNDKAIYSPVRNILDANLPNTTVNDLFKKYGDALSTYTQVKTQQWENDRVSCAADVNDFLYNYIKQGNGTTPPGLWSKLLQSNFFQSRNGPWNDYDGDGLINGQFDSTGQQHWPQGVSSGLDGVGNLKGPYDDWYGFGVPNTYNPLVQWVQKNFPGSDGFAPIPDVAAALGLGLDPAVADPTQTFTNQASWQLHNASNGGLVRGCPANNENDCMPYMFSLTYGDSDFKGNVIGPTDMYVRNILLNDSQKGPMPNKVLFSSNGDDGSAGLANFIDSGNLLGEAPYGINYDQNEPNPRGGGNGDQSVTVFGPVLTYTYNSSQALKQIRTFSSQTAFESEEIKKILVDNCVRMADLQGIMGRLEFQTLIADRMARGIASDQIQQQQETLGNMIAEGDDWNGDGQGDGTDPAIIIKPSEQLKNEAGQRTMVTMNPYLESSDPLVADGAQNAGVAGFNYSNPQPTITSDDIQILQETYDSTHSNNFANSNQNQSTQGQSFVSRIFGYLVGAIGNSTNYGGLFGPPPINFNSSAYWHALNATFDPQVPNNPARSFVILYNKSSTEFGNQLDISKAAYTAGGGYKDINTCIDPKPDGSCGDYASIPAGVIKNTADKLNNAGIDQLTNVHSNSDLENTNDQTNQ